MLFQAHVTLLGLYETLTWVYRKLARRWSWLRGVAFLIHLFCVRVLSPMSVAWLHVLFTARTVSYMLACVRLILL